MSDRLERVIRSSYLVQLLTNRISMILDVPMMKSIGISTTRTKHSILLINRNLTLIVLPVHLIHIIYAQTRLFNMEHFCYFFFSIFVLENNPCIRKEHEREESTIGLNEEATPIVTLE